MRIRYEFVDGTIEEIEVGAEWTDIILALDSEEKNSNRRETRRHTSLSGMDYEGVAFKAADDVVEELLHRDDEARLMTAMKALSVAQRELVFKVYFEGRSLVSIADEEGVEKSAISHRLERIHKKLRKTLK